MAGALSSLGIGSGVLTQDILDQLRKADEAAKLTPVKLEIANQKDMQAEFDVIDAKMTNLKDAIYELQNATLFDGRKATVTGTSVSVTADANSDVQDFTIDVTKLATKQIEQSGSFSAKTDKIANGVGSVNLNVNGKDFTIDYDANTTLDDFKKAINDIAGTDVDATIVQVASGDFRLFVSSTNTGSAQDITITDNSGNLKGGELTTGLTAVQTAQDAEFTFNGQTITRASNTVTDLITGYTITLNEAGKSDVKVEQDRDAIMEKIDSFVEHYNAAISELQSATKSSTDKNERGIFSGESTMRSLLSDLQDMIGSVGGGVGNLYEYGFDLDKNGKISIDKSVLEGKLDENPANVEAFFSGGDFTKSDGTVVTLTGAFGEMTTQVEAYTKTSAILDQLSDEFSQRLSDLEDREQSVIDSLDAKYEIMQKKFAAYDSMINRLKVASNTFIQMANTQTASQNNS